MDFFGYIISFCLVLSIFISNLIFIKESKKSNLKLRKTKLYYFFMSVFSLVLVFFILIIYFGFIEDNLFPDISNFRKTLWYRALILPFVIFFYFIFQYLVYKSFIKKINQKRTNEDYKEIGLDINE